MLTIVLYLIASLVGLVVILLIVLAFRPNEFAISRSLKIDAPAEVIFPHVNSMAAWETWSPYEKLDPNMQKTITGPESGVGSEMKWNGNGNTGSGSTTIVASQPYESIAIDLKMSAPMKCDNDVLFTFQPEDGGTVVTWSMSGKLNMMAKFAHLILNVDKMCGDQFIEGLTSLKELSEQQAAASET
ncbi:SRPBCC family protein [Bremerella cremea]|uniref:SRPBCC family protein n=1 Tax=Bremerella cremea TaxID=1031537 RepID=UPI0031E648CC